MPFAIDDFDMRRWLDPNEDGIPVLEESEVSEAIRLSILTVMNEYNKALNRIVGQWKEYNKPVFAPNVSVERQLGLSRIESAPIEFNLENSAIFHLVSKGARAHGIKPKPDGPGYLAFKGWDLSDRYEDRNRESYQERKARSVGVRKGGRGPRDTILAKKFSQAERDARYYPPTWQPASSVRSFTSRNPQALGDAILQILPNPKAPDDPLVNHPGFEGRQFEEMFESGVLPGEGNMQDLYYDQVTAHLERAAGRRLTGGVAPQVRGGGRAFYLEGGQKNYAVQSFIKRYNENLDV